VAVRPSSGLHVDDTVAGRRHKELAGLRDGLAKRAAEALGKPARRTAEGAGAGDRGSRSQLSDSRCWEFVTSDCGIGCAAIRFGRPVC
jgi:hypothetical protein